MKIDLNKGVKTPVYQQIVECIKRAIDEGEIALNDQIPSINQIANNNKIARETVVKAFKLLQEQGIIQSIHGKGFFISTDRVQTQHRVFLLLDALTPYKQKMYESIRAEFCSSAFIDLYFHHYNTDQFSKLLEEAHGNYTTYVVLPFDDKKVSESIGILPPDKTLIIDQKPNCINTDCTGVYQDFHNDVYMALNELNDPIKSYSKLTLVFRNAATLVPNELRKGFERFTSERKVQNQVLENLNEYKPQKGEAFLVIDDEDLVYLVEYSMANNLHLGKDIGIISYNETALKRVVAGGISVISTDFELMGKTVAQMILTNQHKLIANPCKVINRNSF